MLIGIVITGLKEVISIIGTPAVAGVVFRAYSGVTPFRGGGVGEGGRTSTPAGSMSSASHSHLSFRNLCPFIIAVIRLPFVCV